MSELSKLDYAGHHTAGRPTAAEKIPSESSTATDNCSCECHKTFDEVDRFLPAFDDITNPTFKAWYCKAIYNLGCQRFTDLADQSRKHGRNPARHFSALLKANLEGRAGG